MATCVECEEAIQTSMEENRQGGCAKCVESSTKYNDSPCRECAEEETPQIKFPRFKLAKIWKTEHRK